MRVRAADRGILTKLKFLLFGWLIKKQWRDHYRELARLVRDDMAQADAASTPVASGLVDERENDVRGVSEMRNTRD